MTDERLERAAIALFKECTNWAEPPDHDAVMHLWNMQMEGMRDSFRAKARAVMVELDEPSDTEPPADMGDMPVANAKDILTDLRTPIAWDGHEVTWMGEWKPDIPLDHVTIPQCPGPGLPHREHLWHRQGWVWKIYTTILLERCAYCGRTTATTYSDEDKNEGTWVLDESDYGPSGSFEEEDL